MKRTLTIALLGGALLVSIPGFVPAQENPAEAVKNGSFETGTEGWMWEQWAGKPLPGTVEKQDGHQGKGYFKMGVPGAAGGRYLAKEIPVPEPGKDYVFSFALKFTDVPEGAARVALGIPDKGFFRGGDLVKDGGTKAWKEYKFALPAASLGDAKKVTVFFYHDQVGSGSIGIDALSLVPGTLAAGEATALPNANAPVARGATLAAQTSKPDYSTFAQGEKVELTFTAADLKPAATPLSLKLAVVDEHGTAIESKELPVTPDATGAWRGTFVAPSHHLGYYRVNASLSNGLPLQGSGSRPPGFLTYVVVPDPAQRKDYGDKGSRFGMQGGFGPWGDEVLRLLGARWVLDGSLEWRKTEPNRAGEFEPAKVIKVDYKEPLWDKYTLPTLYAAPQWAVKPETLAYMTGTLTPEGEKAWDAYCRKAAKAYIANNPERKEHIYQITWEPIRSWGFKGTDADLVRVYEIAYRALHEVDPAAVVAGPTRGINNNDPQKHIPLFKAGLGKYLDAYTTHPYHNINPERDGMIQDIRAMKDVLKTYAKPNLPMMGTEQGWSTEENPDKDLEQARGLMRQNLITLGEGFQFNMAFYIADYRLSGQKGYGYYYTLDGDVPFGPKQISPRPIAAAYAAQSWLLDGHDSAGAIEWLGDTAWGYVFDKPGDTVLALWDYGTANREVSLPVGANTVQVYDWMGNSRAVTTQGGTLTLKLGPEPVYVTGVSAKLWGRGAEKVLSIAAPTVQAYPGSKVKIAAGALLPGTEPLKSTLNLEADQRLNLAALTRPLTLGGNQRSPYDFEIAVPGNIRPGTYPLKLMLRDAAGHTLAATGSTLQVISPLTVTGIQSQSQPNGSASVALALKDVQGQGISGELEFRLKEVLPAAARSDLPMIDLVEDPAKTRDIPNSVRHATFDLKPGGAQQITVAYPRLDVLPDKIYQAVVTLTTKGGYSFTHVAPINFLAAHRLNAKPAIDGQLEDWNAVPAIALAGKASVIRAAAQYRGDEDLASQWRLGWDQQALYLAVKVTDDTFNQRFTGGDTWQDDSLQLAFDLDAGHEVADDKRRHTEINVALTPAGAQAYRSLTFDLDKYPTGQLPTAQFPVAIRHEGTSIYYEMTIPWTTLGGTTTPGSALGFAATVNDSDGPEDKEPAALGLYGGIHPTKEPSEMGLLTLDP